MTASFTRVRRALVASALGVVSLVVLAEGADAHAIVKDTVPAIDATLRTSPRQVVMTFNEPVELAFGAIRVYDSNRDRVDDGDASHEGGADTIAVDLEPALPDGTYTVTWRVVSADGHPIQEAFVFHVGAPGARPEGIASELLGGEGGAGHVEGALAGIARWLTFASLLVLVGAVAFALVVWARQPLSGDSAEGFRRWWRRAATVALIGGAIGTVAAYVLQGAVAGDLALGDALDSDVLREVADTRFGKVAIVRLVLLAVAAGVVWWQRDRLPGGARRSVGAAVRSKRVPPVGSVVLAAVLVALAATPGLGGHAGTTPPVVVNVIADTVHVAAAGAWLGGLVLLLAAIVPAGRRQEHAVEAGSLVARYSDVALIAIAAVVVAGIVRSWVEVRALDALDETYGLVLLAKIAVFVPIVIAGFVNNRILKPRLAAVEPGRAWSTLRRVVSAEVALAVVVIALTALLVNLTPARVAAGTDGPFVTDLHLGAYHLNVIVDPNEVGDNQIHLTATTTTGAAAPIEAMTVLFRMPDQEIGPLVAEGRQLAPGHFVVQGRQLSVAGRWVLEIVARTGRFDEERAQTTLLVN